MRSRHRMPFGAEVGPEGVTFRLWAPGAGQVGLRLEGEAAGLAMRAEEDGWHRLRTDRAGPGSRYRFRIDDRIDVPDPASRFQPEDVHGPSEVIDPLAFAWDDGGWTGRAWEEMVFYELHVGTFTPGGTFRSVADRLDHLVDLGVTAVELMPVADFPGRFNWGYDGVLPFAPDGRYGRPEDLKALVAACHARNLAVFLDVVYNHFGPEGNYLGLYAPDFFTGRHETPWGAALDLDGPRSASVRAFFRENALFWLEEYHLDGLRLDAVHALHDDSPVHLLDEIAAAVRQGPGAHRAVHLVLENDGNEARYLRPDAGGRRPYAAQWNDDVHHALHAIATGEGDGYYVDYPDPVAALGRCLTEGFAYQGEPSGFRGHPRGEPTTGVPLTAFVSFLQNHDQVGNRAFGERLEALAGADALRAVTAVMLLAPSPPLLFMGEEWNAAEPFLFFCDFGEDLAGAVREGRRREFARFPAFADPARRAEIPDPQAETTFQRSRLDWAALGEPRHRAWWQWTRGVLALRHREIVPHLAGRGVVAARVERLGPTGLAVRWTFGDGATLRLRANLGASALEAGTGRDEGARSSRPHQAVPPPRGPGSPGATPRQGRLPAGEGPEPPRETEAVDRVLFSCGTGEATGSVLPAWHVEYALEEEPRG